MISRDTREKTFFLLAILEPFDLISILKTNEFSKKLADFIHESTCSVRKMDCPQSNVQSDKNQLIAR